MQELRASDADRETAITALRHHHRAGRLDVDSFEERVRCAQEATTIGELDVLLADLPAEVARARQAARDLEEVTTGAPRWPGIRPFEERKILDAPLEEVADRVREIMAPALEQVDYTLVQADDKNFAFACRYRPAWTYWAAIFGFPVGLIALWHFKEDRITIRLGRARHGRTRVLVYGRASRSIRRAFATLDD